MMSAAVVPGFRPSSVPLHCVSTPKVHDSAADGRANSASGREERSPPRQMMYVEHLVYPSREAGCVTGDDGYANA